MTTMFCLKEASKPILKYLLILHDKSAYLQNTRLLESSKAFINRLLDSSEPDNVSRSTPNPTLNIESKVDFMNKSCKQHKNTKIGRKQKIFFLIAVPNNESTNLQVYHLLSSGCSRNVGNQFHSIFSEYSSTKISQDSSRKLMTRKFPLVAPFISVHRKYPLPKKII